MTTNGGKGGFTKGPWHVLNNGPHWNNPAITNYNIAWSEDGELVAEHVYEESDARLIASAPDLLEALKEAEGWVEEYVIQMGSYTISDDAKKSLKRIRAAIARAEGEGL